MTARPPNPERSKPLPGPGPERRVVLADVTLREHGQNLEARDLDRFPPSLALEVARGLVAAGLRRLELFSCVSPRVAPAMATDRLRAIAEGLGRPPGVTLVTLVPNLRGFESFVELGLGPEGLGHHLGLFFSVVDEHNRRNLGKTMDESLAECRDLARAARRLGVPLVAYLSAAFGFSPAPGELLDAPSEKVAVLAETLRDLGASTVTLSDLQGVRSPAQTRDRLGELIHRLGPASTTWLGYHPHHALPEAGVALAEAAFEAGVRLFDGSLGAVGGCITGAPGNAPTEGLLAMLRARGALPEVDPAALAQVARRFGGTLEH